VLRLLAAHAHEQALLVATASAATTATARVHDDEHDDGRNHGERGADPQRASRDGHLDLPSIGDANFTYPYADGRQPVRRNGRGRRSLGQAAC
jgi:hypothetical protein